MLQIRGSGFKSAFQYLNNVQKKVDNLESFYKGPALRSVKRSFSEIFRNEGETKRTNAWRPLKNRRRLRANRKILQNTGRLRQSYVNTPVVQIQNNVMRVSSNVPYAKFHELGTRYIPKRPVVAYAKVILEPRLQRALNKYIRQVIQNGN